MLFDRVGGVRAGRVGAAGEDVGFLHEGDEVGRVAAAGAFDVVGVDCSSFECRRGAFDEAGFVQGVAVQFALDVVFFADAGWYCQWASDSFWGRCL